MPRKVMILGATSAIAQETARLLVLDGDALFLVARDDRRLHVVVEDLRSRGAPRVEGMCADLADFNRHDEVIDRAFVTLGGLDTLIVAHGILGDQQRCETEYQEAHRVLRTNFLSAASLLNRVAGRFEAQGSGTIVGISSVAGDRARPTNYVYGTSKGALSLFLQGLRARLHGKGVHVLTVKPGFVDTPMTRHLDKNPLFAKPSTIARGIHRAMRRGKDVVYLPWFWRWIMLIIRLIPERIFKRMRI